MWNAPQALLGRLSEQTQPVLLSLAFLTVGGFIAGIILLGRLQHRAGADQHRDLLHSAATRCENNVFARELKTTIHYSQPLGRARRPAPDCHVPHEWTDKIARKMQASKEVWGKLFGTINTPEKFQAKRLEMAEREWTRFKANNSLECRNCHSEKSMDFTRQSPRAAEAHERFLVSNEKTCIDCHKGIAHHLPEMKATTMTDSIYAAMAAGR